MKTIYNLHCRQGKCKIIYVEVRNSGNVGLVVVGCHIGLACLLDFLFACSQSLGDIHKVCTHYEGEERGHGNGYEVWEVA